MNNLEQQRKKLEGLVNNQIDPASGLAINCRNCIHCEISSVGADFDKCLKCGGEYCEFVFRFQNLHNFQCKNHDSWAPRKKSLLELLSDRIRKILE